MVVINNIIMCVQYEKNKIVIMYNGVITLGLYVNVYNLVYYIK